MLAYSAPEMVLVEHPVFLHGTNTGRGGLSRAVTKSSAIENAGVHEILHDDVLTTVTKITLIGENARRNAAKDN